MNHYLKDTHVDESNLKRQNFARRLRLGKTLYVSTSKVIFPIVIKFENNDFIKRELTANIIDSEEVPFFVVIRR